MGYGEVEIQILVKKATHIIEMNSMNLDINENTIILTENTGHRIFPIKLEVIVNSQLIKHYLEKNMFTQISSINQSWRKLYFIYQNCSA